MIDENTFGQWLSSSRRAAGFSQRQFGERLGIPDPVVVNELEHDRLDPKPYAHRVAKELNADVSYVESLAAAHEQHASRREIARRSIEAKMLAFRLERGAR